MRLNLPNSCCLFLTMRQFADIEIEVFDVKDTKTDVAFVVALTNTYTHTAHLVWKILIKVKNYALHKRRMNETNEKHEIKRRR